MLHTIQALFVKRLVDQSFSLIVYQLFTRLFHAYGFVMDDITVNPGAVGFRRLNQGIKQTLAPK